MTILFFRQRMRCACKNFSCLLYLYWLKNKQQVSEWRLHRCSEFFPPLLSSVLCIIQKSTSFFFSNLCNTNESFESTEKRSTDRKNNKTSSRSRRLPTLHHQRKKWTKKTSICILNFDQVFVFFVFPLNHVSFRNLHSKKRPVSSQTHWPVECSCSCRGERSIQTYSSIVTRSILISDDGSWHWRSATILSSDNYMNWARTMEIFAIITSFTNSE